MVFSKPNRERQKLMREQNILKQVGEAGRAGPGRLGERRAGAALGRLARPPPFTNPTSFLRAVFYPYSVSEWEAPRSRVPRAPARTNTASPVTRAPPTPHQTARWPRLVSLHRHVCQRPPQAGVASGLALAVARSVALDKCT